MGTAKVTVHRTAKKKDGQSQGAVKTTTKVAVDGNTRKITTTKTRTVSKTPSRAKGINVNYVKSS